MCPTPSPQRMPCRSSYSIFYARAAQADCLLGALTATQRPLIALRQSAAQPRISSGKECSIAAVEVEAGGAVLSVAMSLTDSFNYQLAHIDESRQGQLIAINVTLISLSTIAVVLRFVARHLMKARWGWDDYCIFLAEVGSCEA